MRWRWQSAIHFVRVTHTRTQRLQDIATQFSAQYFTLTPPFLPPSQRHACILSLSLSLTLSLSVRALRTKRPSLPEERLHSAPRWTRRGQESPHQSAASGQHQAAPSNDHRHRFAKTYCCCSPAAFPSFPLYSSSFSSSLTAFAQAEALPKLVLQNKPDAVWDAGLLLASQQCNSRGRWCGELREECSQPMIQLMMMVWHEAII